MQRNTQSNDNRFYAFLPPANSTPGRNTSSQSTNRNNHYHYYDPRVRSQQQLQQSLYEYQYSPTSPQRTPAALYASPRRQYHYPSSDSLLGDLSSISTNAIADLGEPISIFDDIQPLEYRQPTVYASLPSRYVPPDSSRRPSASEVRLATATVVREQLLTDIERTINDIDRDLTSLERRPSGPRYLPPRFSPIDELGANDLKPFRQLTTTLKPTSVSSRKLIPPIDSARKNPVQQQTSARSIAQDSNNSSSQFWPNKPKRVYEVIPRLTGDSKRTSRQSSFTGQPEQIRVEEIQTPQSPGKSLEKSITSATLQYHGQYHYAPEAEEIEILHTDPENVDRKSRLDEFHDSKAQETLNPNHFVRDQSSLSDNQATVTVPKYGGSSPLSYHEPTIKPTTVAIPPQVTREFSASSKHRLDLGQVLNVLDVESVTQPFSGNGYLSRGSASRMEAREAPRIESPVQSLRESPRTPQPMSDCKPRIPSRSTMTPPPLYHKTDDYFDEPENTIISKSVKHVRPTSRSSTITPIATDDQPEKIAASPLPPTPTPPQQPRAPSAQTIDTRAKTATPPPPAVAAPEENENGMVAYFFSDFGNEGESEEDLISIDHSNFNVPTGADVVTDDETGSHMLRPSPGSMPIVRSAHKPPQIELKSTLPATVEVNNEHRKVEEEQLQREESGLIKKRVPASPSILPFSSPSPKQVFPVSITGDMQKQFSRNNSRSYDEDNNNNNVHRPPSSPAMLNKDIPHPHLQPDDDADEEKHSSDSPIRVRSSLSSSHEPSRRQSSKSEHANKERDDHRASSSPPSSSSSSSTLMNNDDDQKSARSSSVKQRSKPSSRALSRRSSALSQRTKSPAIVPRADSSRKSSSKKSSRQQSARYSPPAQFVPQSPQEQYVHYTPPSPPPQPVPPKPQTRSNRFRTTPAPPPVLENNSFPQSFNILVASPTRMQRNSDLEETVSGNQPYSFSAESEHFLRDKSQTPYDLNQRLPSGYSIARSGQASHRSSTMNSPVPVPLDSPDLGNNPPPSSRTTTPKKKHSVSTIELPADPRVLLTTTDAPDPDDPSVIQSTIHFQMFPSEAKPSKNVTAKRPSPMSPSRNVVPTVEAHPMESHREKNYSPTQSKPVSPLRHEVNEPMGRSVSPEKDELRPEVSNQTPLLSYPARLEDLMRPTPSPFRSGDDRLSPASPMEKPIAEHHNLHTVIPISSSKFTPNVQPSPSSSRHRSVSSDDDHTSVEVDESQHPTAQSPPLVVIAHRIASPPPEQHHSMPKQTLLPPPKEPTFITETPRHPSSERSVSVAHEQHQQAEHVGQDHQQTSSTPVQHAAHDHSSPRGSISNDDDLPYMTPSQQHSKLSLRLRKQQPKRKKSFPHSSSPIPQKETDEAYSTHDEDGPTEEQEKPRRRRRVSFSHSVSHFQMEERQLLTNWRERVAALLASKHQPNEKYSHVTARVNSFANFEYQPRKIKMLSRKQLHAKMNEQNNSDENKFAKRKKYKVKKPKMRPENFVEEQTDEDLPEPAQSAKETAPQLFGRLWCLPDGSPTVFHESLEWNAQSRLKPYTLQNAQYAPQRSDRKIFNRKPKWSSESKLADLMKETPRTMAHSQGFTRSTPRYILAQATSLPTIPGESEAYTYSPHMHRGVETKRKIYDIQSNTQQQSEPRSRPGFSENVSYRSYSPKTSDVQIFNERLSWEGKSRLKDTTWENIDYEPKKSNVQIFHKSVHWNSEPKIRTRSPSTVNQSRASNSNVQIYDAKLNWDAQAKVQCWSEIDLRELTKKKAIFAQHRDPKWNDIVTARVDATNYNYPRQSNNVEIFSDRLMWTQDSKLKDYVWENFDYKAHPRTRPSTDRRHLPGIDQTPANRPKWNAVSKNTSVNSVYNPRVTNGNMIRRGWDRDLRRKRVHKLPPLKRKREYEDTAQLALDAPSSLVASTSQLALDYHNDHSSVTHGRTPSNGYMTRSSRRSSKALVPLNHRQLISQLEMPVETPRSQRPVQQEWYDEMNKSRLTQRTEGDRAPTTRSFRNSIDSIHHPQTPKDLVTFRSSTRNSQNSVMSGTLLDSSIRSNRATELRLQKDMEAHHQHSHTPSQSMPIEIRGFQLEGTPLSVPNTATIRPLSNVNYQASERVKKSRVYPWSSLHPLGTSSRNSSLVPIAELRRPSLDTTINEGQTMIHEE